MSMELQATRSKVLGNIVWINLLLIGIGALAWHGYHSYSTYLSDIVEHQRPLLVFQLQQSALLFAVVPTVSALIVINIEMFFVKLLGRRIPSFMGVIQKLATLVMFLGVALLVFGNQLVNPSWAETFSESGYSKCDTVILRASKQFFNDAWVRNPNDCHDPQLKQILHEDHSRVGFEKGARYLERKHLFLENLDTARSGQ
ncbi:hypothetical protein [uncultured Marinobacter sp.]|uniref:hypothetical protein n=1 Tax=uncultured Marinobacter sp. TaxID=187379 RepID=UPI0030DC8184